MKFAMVHAMYGIATDGTVTIARMLWVDTNHLVFVFRRLILFMIYTAFRLGEIVFHSSTEIMYLTRSSVTFRINFIYLSSPTRAQLLSMVAGRDIAIVQPPRSKSDPWGEIHCAFPIYLTYGNELGNVAGALRDIELRLPCEGETLREATALFADENGNPYTYTKMHGLLRTVLTHLYGSVVASLYTWHSFRSGLATALHASGCAPDMIQLICRWMCPESLQVYRRIGSKEHESRIDAATTANIDSIQMSNVPKVSGHQGYAALFQWCDNDTNTKTPFAKALRGEGQSDEEVPSAASSRITETAHTPAAVHVPAPQTDTRPLHKDNAIGRTVLVQQRLWPRYACHEHNGEGWEATVVSACAATAVVQFVRHTDRQGRLYANERLPFMYLTPL